MIVKAVSLDIYLLLHAALTLLCWALQPGGYCPSFTYNASDPATNGGFCPTSQPAWSAFRQPAFGHGILTFENSTHALWQWNRWDCCLIWETWSLVGSF